MVTDSRLETVHVHFHPGSKRRLLSSCNWRPAAAAGVPCKKIWSRDQYLKYLSMQRWTHNPFDPGVREKGEVCPLEPAKRKHGEKNKFCAGIASIFIFWHLSCHFCSTGPCSFQGQVLILVSDFFIACSCHAFQVPQRFSIPSTTDVSEAWVNKL